MENDKVNGTADIDGAVPDIRSSPRADNEPSSLENSTKVPNDDSTASPKRDSSEIKSQATPSRKRGRPPKGTPASSTGRKVHHAEVNELPTLPTTRGVVYGCGKNDCNQLALGVDRDEVRNPLFINKLSDVASIAAGDLHSLALTIHGEVFSWGCNDDGALGRETIDDDELTENVEFIPGKVVFPEGVKIIQIAAGECSSAAIDSTGQLWYWGSFRNSKGKVGLTDADGQHSNKPIKVDGQARGTRFCKVVYGDNHLVALTTSGRVFVLGDNSVSQLGLRSVMLTDENSEAYKKAQKKFLSLNQLPLKKIIDIAAGSFHSFALAQDGSVYSWGMNNWFQCGFAVSTSNHGDMVSTPTLVKSLSKLNIVKIDAGEHFTLFKDKDGQLFGIGRTDCYQLGIDETNSNVIKGVDGRFAVNKLIRVPLDKKVTTFSCRSSQSAALGEDKYVYTWGFGETYALGHNSEEDQKLPKVIDVLKGKDILDVKMGTQHLLFLVHL